MKPESVVRGILGGLILVLSSACKQEPVPADSEKNVEEPQLETTQDFLTISPGESAMWTEKIAGDDVLDLDRGEKRLVLHLKGYEPPKSSTGMLKISLANSNPSFEEDLWRISILPNNAMAEGSSYLLPRKDYSKYLEEGLLRLKVEFPSNLRAEDGGRAEFKIRLVDQNR